MSINQEQIMNLQSKIHSVFNGKDITPQNVFDLFIQVISFADTFKDLDGEEKKKLCVQLVNELIYSQDIQEKIKGFPIIQLIVNNCLDNFIETTIDVSKKLYDINKSSRRFKSCCNSNNFFKKF